MKAAHGAVADRLATLGHDADALTDDAVAALVLHADGRLDRLQSLLTAALFLGSMDSVARIGREYVQKALAMEAAAAPPHRTAPLRAEPRDAWAWRSRKPRRPGRRIVGALAAAVAAGCLVVPQRWQRPETMVVQDPVAVPPDLAQAAPSPATNAPQPAPPVVQPPVVQPPPAAPPRLAEVPEAPLPAPRPPVEAGVATLVPPPVPDAPAPPPQAAAPPEAPAPAEPSALAETDRVEQPEDPAPAATVGLAQPPQAPRGGAGLLLVARAGDTLPRLYQQVYRGVRPPPYAEFTAANPAVIRPGSLLLFPTPPDGWAQR